MSDVGPLKRVNDWLESCERHDVGSHARIAVDMVRDLRDLHLTAVNPLQCRARGETFDLDWGD